MEPVICIEMIYPDLKPAEKIRKISRYGFRYVEFWGWRDKDIPELKSACLENGVRIANFSGHRKGSLVAEVTHELFEKDLCEAISVAHELDCSILMLLSNELGEGGRVENTYPEIPEADKYANLRLGLEKALLSSPEHILLVLEPLNTRIDHPGYFLDSMETAVSLIKEINNPRLKILCDLYHFGVMNCDLNHLIRSNLDLIGYIHIADFPGRHEPGTGSADWLSLLELLENRNYQGYVGFEYSPENDSGDSLLRIRALWDRAIT